MSTPDSPSALQELAQLITASVTALDAIYKAHGTPFPSLNDPWKPHALEVNEDAKHASEVIMSAAYQLIASVAVPTAQISNMHGGGIYTAGVFQYMVETSVPDILKEGNPAGMHIDEIASKMKNPPAENNRLARVLRYLASRHVFREVTPNVFAHNRTSSAMCKAKSFKEINEDSVKQYDGRNAASIIGHMTDESFLSSTHISAWLQTPDNSLGASPFSVAHKTPVMWNWFEEPGNEMRRNRFTGVMKSNNDAVWKHETYTRATDWAAYPENTTVVDVGGNIGTVSMLLARKFPHLNFVVQDLPQVIETETKSFWGKEWPEFVQKGKVQFQPHDFFTANPTKEADVYFMRMISHNWATPLAATILKQLRDAAKPSTKLLLFDWIMPYACKDPNEKTALVNAPSPLLANLGFAGGGWLTVMDMHMMNLFGAQERTVDEFAELGALSGWKIEKIVPALSLSEPGAVIYTPA